MQQLFTALQFGVMFCILWIGGGLEAATLFILSNYTALLSFFFEYGIDKKKKERKKGVWYGILHHLLIKLM